jgi:mono/diheme cytochrome c family protein
MSNDQDYHNKGGLFAFVLAMGFSIAFILYSSLIHRGVPALDQIQKPVVGDGSQTVAAAESNGPTFDPSKVEKPWLSTPELVAHGDKVFQTNCAVCHGSGYLGDGPAGKALVPPARNLVAGGWKKGGRSQDLYQTLYAGIAGTSMAGFQQLSVVDRWALVHLIRDITKDKPADDPAALEKFAQTAK